MGLEVSMVETLAAYHVKIAFLPIGESLIELCQPTGPGRLQDFIEQRGEGLHHICYRVTNITKALAEIGKNVALRDKTPRGGAAGSKVAFLEPQGIFNVETELVEREQEIQP